MFYFNTRDIQKQLFTGVEAAVRRCFSEYVFKNLEIFIIRHLLQAVRHITLLERDSNTGALL